MAALQHHQVSLARKSAPTVFLLGDYKRRSGKRNTRSQDAMPGSDSRLHRKKSSPDRRIANRRWYPTPLSQKRKHGTLSQTRLVLKSNSGRLKITTTRMKATNR